jgi:hypothetical protein
MKAIFMMSSAMMAMVMVMDIGGDGDGHWFPKTGSRAITGVHDQALLNAFLTEKPTISPLKVDQK